MISLEEDDEGKVIKPPHFFSKKFKQIFVPIERNLQVSFLNVGPFPLLPKPPGYIALQVISILGNDQVSKVQKNKSLNWAGKPQTAMERCQSF